MQPDFDWSLLQTLFSFSPEDLADLKMTAVKVGAIWALVEWRTWKRFGSLEKAIKSLTETIHEVKDSDTSSTKLLNERLERQSGTITSLSNLLHRTLTRVTITEVKLGIVPPLEETTQEK